MYMMMPLPDINPLTDKQDGSKIGLVDISPMSITNISEDPETGYAVITYKQGEVLETLCPFILVMQELMKLGVVNVSALHLCEGHSKNLRDYLKANINNYNNLPMNYTNSE